MTLPKNARRKVLSALLAGFFFSPVACKGKEAVGPSGPPPAAAKRPAAPTFALKDLQGRTVSLSQFKGKKAVFLEFWATWCGPCRMSMPAVEMLHQEYGPKGLQVLGISVDDETDAVAPFVRSIGVGYPVLIAGASGVDGLYQVSGIPAFYLIDKAGNVADAWMGFDPSFAGQWRRAADQILAQ